MTPPLARIYELCHELFKAMELVRHLMLLSPDNADVIALKHLEPPTKELSKLLSVHQRELIRLLGSTKSVRCFTKDGATVPHAILRFATKFMELGAFYSDEMVRRDGMEPLRDGIDDARSLLLIEEARLGVHREPTRATEEPPSPGQPKGLTRDEIARQLGVSAGRVRGWARRQNDPLEQVAKRGAQPLYDLEEARRILRGGLPPD